MYLRITQDRKIAHIGTDVYLEKNHWNPKGTLDNRDWVKKPLKSTFNTVLEAQALGLEHPQAMAKEIKAKMEGEQAEYLDFIGFYGLELERIMDLQLPPD